MTLVHPTAMVDPRAAIAPTAAIGPGVRVEAGVRVGSGCRVLAGAVLRAGTVLGAACVVAEHAVVGGDPQDLAFDPRIPSGVSIGDGTVVREGATIHRATVEGGVTRIGAGCLLMVQCHVAHDCELGRGVVVANFALLAGHVRIGDHAFISGHVAIHQHCRIGRLAMVGGMTKVTQDVPPFAMVEGNPARHRGMNRVGLRRAGIRVEDRRRIAHLLKLVVARGAARATLARLEAESADAWRDELSTFVATSRRGVLARS